MHRIVKTDRVDFHTKLRPRTTIFYVMGAAVIVTDIVMAPIGSWLLMQDLWLPFKFSSLIMLLAVPVALSMSETLAKQQTLRDAFDNGPVEASGHRSLVWTNRSAPLSALTAVY